MPLKITLSRHATLSCEETSAGIGIIWGSTAELNHQAWATGISWGTDVTWAAGIIRGADAVWTNPET